MSAKISFTDLVESGEFTLEDRKELRSVLGNKSVRRALKEVLTLAEGMDKLSSVDLDGREGLSVALRQAGTVRGLLLAVETLIDLTEEI